MMNEWRSIWPNRGGRIGQLQALQWMVICLLMVSYVATYFRVSLQVFYKLMLNKGLGMSGGSYLGFQVSTALCSLVLYGLLWRFFIRCLYVPCHAVSLEKLPKGEDNSWKLLVGMNSVCVLLPAFAILHALLMGVHNLTFAEWARLALLLAIGGYSFRLAAGAELTSPPGLPKGRMGSVAELVVGVSVWSNLAFLLSHSVYMPFSPTEHYALSSVKYAGVGALIALTHWQLRGVKWPVWLGLAVSFVGGPWLGTLLSRGVGLFGVLSVDYWEERDLPQAVVRTVGFGLGQALGRLLGGGLAFFYLGLDGGEVGATIGEAVAATLGFQLTGEKKELKSCAI